jgi:hypothetical protein
MADYLLSPLGFAAAGSRSTFSIHGSFRVVIAQAGVDPGTLSPRPDQRIASYLFGAGMTVADISRFVR